jgi:hypothetical protein
MSDIPEHDPIDYTRAFPPPPPPAAPALSGPPHQPWYKRKGSLVGGVLALGIIVGAVAAGGNNNDPADAAQARPAAPTTTLPCGSNDCSTPRTTVPATTVPATTQPPATAPPATTVLAATLPAECVSGATDNRNVTATSYEAWWCVDGQWQFRQTVTIAPTITTATVPYKTWVLLYNTEIGVAMDQITGFEDQVTAPDSSLGDIITTCLEATRYMDMIDGLTMSSDNPPPSWTTFVTEMRAGFAACADVDPPATTRHLANANDAAGELAGIIAAVSDSL